MSEFLIQYPDEEDGLDETQSDIDSSEQETIITDDKDDHLKKARFTPLEIVTGEVDDGVLSDPDGFKEDMRTISRHLDLLEQRIVQLGLDFESKLKYDSHKEKIIDNLHAELQVYKDGLIERLLRPVFMDIIEVVDDTRRLLKDLKKRGEEDNSAKLNKILDSIPSDLEDLLYKHGVEIIQSDSDTFNPAYQKVLKVATTESENLDKKIHERLKNGYSWEGKLLRHEMVSVWQFSSNS